MAAGPCQRAILASSPVGPLSVIVRDGRVAGLEWAAIDGVDDPLAQKAVDQLAAYFSGQRERFDLPLARPVTQFQGAFLDALCDIPFGQTRTYGDLARALGVSAQSIGQACGANPIPIIVPCHRVLAQCGLGGYSGAGGIESKVTLLRHECAASLLI